MHSRFVHNARCHAHIFAENTRVADFIGAAIILLEPSIPGSVSAVIIFALTTLEYAALPISL